MKMKKWERIIVYSITFFALIYSLWAYSKLRRIPSFESQLGISFAPESKFNWSKYFDEKYRSLCHEIISSMPANWESQLPFTIYSGKIWGNPEYEIAINFDLMVNKEDALKAGKEGQKELLLEIYNQIKKWIVVNYSEQQHYRLYLRIFIPNQDVFIAAILKTSSYPNAPIDIQFGEIFF